MCSYKAVEVRLDVWGIQGRVEDFIQKSIREILLVGHRQAVAWLDDWYGMTIEDVREYELKMQSETNARMQEDLKEEQDELDSSEPSSGSVTPGTPAPKKGWFPWS
ncbi:hypothetical protein TCAL_07686 [Tigriopus californicus]|uniref:Phosphatidylinositol transfer protein N-terminal domain-containing protein n=2 Tax=Tigriopus californicus TaxID=6832 RepID=A0A553NT86_TIGCA|nr:hypothetical protein TCAL_07686 [Tigriopus californicus]